MRYTDKRKDFNIKDLFELKQQERLKIIKDRISDNKDSNKLVTILNILAMKINENSMYTCFASAVCVELQESGKLSRLNKFIHKIPISDFAILTYIRHASRNNYIHRNVLVAEVLRCVEKLKNYKFNHMFGCFSFPKNLITMYYYMTNKKNCLSICSKLKLDFETLLIDTEYNNEAYKSLSDILKTLDDKDCRHLVDLNLLKGHVETLSDKDFHEQIKGWVSKKNKIFAGPYRYKFNNICNNFFTRKKSLTIDQLKDRWYHNLLSDGSAHIDGIPRVSKTFVFSSSTPEMEWDKFIYMLNETDEPMISYPSQKNEVGKTRAIANTNMLSHYIMTLIYTIFMENSAQVKDQELYALLSPKGQTELFCKLSEYMKKGCVSNSIDQSKFDWNVRMYQILSVSKNVMKLNTSIDSLIPNILKRIANGIVVTNIGTLKHQDGLLSGWKTTSLFGSLINKMQAMVVEQVAREIEPLFQCAILKAYMGDDVIHIYRYRRDAMLLNRIYRETGLQISFSKTIISNVKAEFLRTQIYPGNQKFGYPARAVTSIFCAKPWSPSRSFSVSSWSTNTAVYYRRTQSLLSKLFVMYVLQDIIKTKITNIVKICQTPAIIGGLNMWTSTNREYAELKISTFEKTNLTNVKADRALPPISLEYFYSLSPKVNKNSPILSKLGLLYRAQWLNVQHEYKYSVKDVVYDKKDDNYIYKEKCTIRRDNEHMRYSKIFLNSFAEPLTGIWSIIRKEQTNYKEQIKTLDSIKKTEFHQSSRIQSYRNISRRLMSCLITGKIGTPSSYVFSSSDQSSIYSELVATALMRRSFLTAGIQTLVDIHAAAMDMMYTIRDEIGYDYW